MLYAYITNLVLSGTKTDKKWKIVLCHSANVGCERFVLKIEIQKRLLISRNIFGTGCVGKKKFHTLAIVALYQTKLIRDC